MKSMRMIAFGTLGSLCLLTPAFAGGNRVTEEARLKGGSVGSWLGHAVSLSGERALVGVPYQWTGGIVPGSAFVFVRNGTSWTKEAELTASDGSHGDLFGWSVSISGDTALVGSERDGSVAKEAGSAYVFVRNGTDWTEQAKLTASDAGEYDSFGVSVAIAGDMAFVGADRVDGPHDNSGAIYVFTRSGTVWTERDRLTGDFAGQFGISVAISGNRLLVGAYKDGQQKLSSGSAYVFERNGSNWVQQDKLMPSDPKIGQCFGTSVALHGDVALIGAPRDKPIDQAQRGSAYVFVRQGTDWVQQAKLIGTSTSLHFGQSVAVWDNLAFVGSPLDDRTAENAGVVYLFRQQDSQWAMEAPVVASDTGMYGQFGRSLAFRGDTALVGALGATSTGTAYVLRVPPDPTSYCTAKTGLTCGTPAIAFEGLPCASSTSGFVISAGPAVNNRVGLFLYTDQGPANLPFQGGTLCVQPPIRRSVAVNSGGAASCEGRFTLDWSRFAHGLLGGSPAGFLLSPGQQVHVQGWGRDSQQTGSFLSDGLEYVVLP